jgi:hypothetical protein
MPSLHLVPQVSAQPQSILAEGFSGRLANFNDLTRDIREIGIVIKVLAFPDNKIFIDPTDVELFSRRFGHELRGLRYSAEGRVARNTVTVRGVEVVWFNLIKEQGQ